MEPIRILYLIDDLQTSRAGSEQHLLWLLRTIPEPEFEKHFIVCSALASDEPAVLEHRPLVLGERYGTGPLSWPGRFQFLVRYLREHRIDLVQAFNPIAELVAATAVRRAGRGCVIGNRRDCGYDKHWKRRFAYRASRFFGARYIANSEAAAHAANRNDGTPLTSIEVIRNPVSFRRIQEALASPIPRSELPIPEEARRGKLVGMVATVRPIKDYETLIRASNAVLEAVPDTWFLFVGEADSAYQKELERLAESLGVSGRIVWFGPVDNPLRILPTFDVAVLSTHSESFSNAVLEYAAAERPIVVSDVGGLGELVEDGRTGLLVPPEDPASLGHAIVRILEDPELARSLGEAAKRFVLDEYDENKILGQYVEFYRSAAGKTTEDQRKEFSRKT